MVSLSEQVASFSQAELPGCRGTGAGECWFLEAHRESSKAVGSVYLISFFKYFHRNEDTVHIQSSASFSQVRGGH